MHLGKGREYLSERNAYPCKHGLHPGREGMSWVRGIASGQGEGGDPRGEECLSAQAWVASG